jgi:hypothetical protein
MTNTHYEIVVRGHVGEGLVSALDGLTARATTAHTVLYGAIPDQVALFSVLDRLDSLGLELLVVRRAASGH